ncbi:MAG TPA: hypothetical protein PKE57_08575 [Cellvibrionaceae bacterium]|nr:hypothetical protein [Cellvibrionaceae bacterium]HMW46754.1 hypothetical protein [Cellvibrionaceae bacterium]HMY39056.1 hypothetical protein [Marinagarivorans sp.]HNG61315.1 hypothetical protein [Cellvibrionaceae bacterium]
MWSKLSCSLKDELEYLFAAMAEAALPDQLWLPTQLASASSTQAPKPAQH